MFWRPICSRVRMFFSTSFFRWSWRVERGSLSCSVRVWCLVFLFVRIAVIMSLVLFCLRAESIFLSCASSLFV